MAKKNSQKDTSGVVFDTHSKMVMSQGGTFEKMKEKINAVRAVVPNKSNNEIVLVLQHFENSVDRTVQAFVEGYAVEILKEWNVTGKKKPKKKKKPKPQAESSAGPGLGDPSQPPDTPTDKDGLNGFHANGSALDGDSADSLSEQMDSVSLDTAELDSEPATPDLSDTTGTEVDDGKARADAHVPRAHHLPRGPAGKPRSRPGSQPSSALSLALPEDGQHPSATSKRIASNIDKSVKDLQRCTASLTRYRVVVKEEMDSSIKKMKQTFAELQSCLMDREVALLAEMDKVKAEAMAILDGRQKKAEMLRRLTDQAGSMSEEQLSELRADIKHFVSERKYDEDLGRALKFTYELEPAKKNIMSFGSVYHPQTGYSSRSRCSSASSSLTGPGTPEGPPPPLPQASGYGPRESGARPAPAHRQGYQGNRRPGHGYQPGGQQQSNSASHPDRNPNRTSHRYPGNRGQGAAPPTSSSSLPSTNGSAQSLPPHQDRPTPNGLPQRPPRTHCP
ncbi:spermatogenesis-associated serine-rich protein 2 isoform X2 [Lepisosteus oculatus]|uniref:spermatogenesis-associated serine-rich protein 2 isoform X2 n=1 Tax=Lepisosteus oculatus TaxID=7918 RepID=UPI0035F501F7